MNERVIKRAGPWGSDVGSHWPVTLGLYINVLIVSSICLFLSQHHLYSIISLFMCKLNAVSSISKTASLL